MHRITAEECYKIWADYRSNYPQFRPFTLSQQQQQLIGNKFWNVITTQNGQDFDDYSVGDDNKVEKYCKDIPKGSAVLFLGTGTGRETKVALDMGLNAVGLTLGSRNVEFGKRYLGLTDQMHWEGICEILPYPKETFDAIFGFQIFEHAMAPMLFLLEQGRVLKPNGKLMLEWPPAKDYTMGDNPHHQVCFTPGQAHALFLKAGFKDVKLYFADGSTVPEEELWRGDQNQMICIEGTKGSAHHEHIRRAWQ